MALIERMRTIDWTNRCQLIFTPVRKSGPVRARCFSPNEGACEMVAWTNKQGYEWCEILDIDSMVGRLLQPDLRPGKWAGEDIRKAMGYFTKENRRHDDQRRGVTLVHNDLVGSAGMSPAISISFQPILPGEKLAFHRHNYVAIYYWIEGEG